MAKMLITKEQYNSLSPMGVELHQYWMNFKPEMYQEMAQVGTLWQTLQIEDQRLDEMVIELIHSGLAEDQAKEMARAEIYDLIEDETDEIEETEQDRRSKERYDLFMEILHLADEE